MGFHYICCEYVLLAVVNKKTVLAYGNTEYSKTESTSSDKGWKKAGSGRYSVATQETRHKVTNHKPGGKI